MSTRLAEMPEPLGFEISDNPCVKTVALYLCSNDAQGRNRKADFLREACHVVDDLINTPG